MFTVKGTSYAPNKRFLYPDFRLRFAWIVTHYWRNAAFVEDGQLLENADCLNDIPGVLVHGTYDVSVAPPKALVEESTRASGRCGP